MRSLFLEKSQTNLSLNQKTIIISDKSKLHHLNNVLRIRLETPVILFNEDSHCCRAKLIKLSKKEASFDIEKAFVYDQPHEIELALCWLKKEALETAIVNAVQVGVSRIHLVKSEYSQPALDLSKSRFHKLIVSAMEQSNHFVKPEVIEYSSLMELLESNNSYHFYGFTLHLDLLKPIDKIEGQQRCIYLIGPEGGLSYNEISMLKGKNMKFFHLPTPIMRAPVAVSCALGYIIAQTKGMS